MKLLTGHERARLLANGALRKRIAEEGFESLPACDLDFLPVVKLFTPDANATWLLTEIDPDDTDRAFGLCDLGLGFPELGYVSLGELGGLRGKLGLPVERDLHFVPAKPISRYAADARAAGRITT